MTRPSLMFQGMNIVLLGDFNPRIFQPAWFAAHDLIGESEAETAEIEIIHSDVVVYSTDWLRLQVTRDRFHVSTTQEPYYEVMRDLVIATFTLLEHTPIHSMGINTDFHFKMNSVEELHSLGHTLAPKSPWGDLLISPGMRNLTMEGLRTDSNSGFIRVQVAPSNKIQNGAGVYIATNDHYQVNEPKGSIGCIQIISILNESWESSVRMAKNTSDKLLEIR